MVASRHSILALFAFCLTFVVNPGYFGCTSGPQVPDFGEAEMLELLDEANATAPFDLAKDGESYRLEVAFEQKAGDDVEDLSSRPPGAAFATRAYACGNRTFQASAAACITRTSVPVSARVTLVRLDPGGETTLIDDQEFDGELWVGGYKLTNGWVTVNNAETAAQIDLRSSDGKTFEFERMVTRLDGFPTTF